MKAQMTAQNEILMMLSTNKMLRESMNPSHQTSVQQPSTMNDFATQFQSMRKFEDDMRARIEEEMGDYDDDDDDDEIEGMMKSLLTPILHGNNPNGKAQLGDPETKTAEAEVDTAMQ
jgi:hypothetical protein